MVVKHGGRNNPDHDPAGRPRPGPEADGRLLPVRWIVIIAVATGLGLAVGQFGGVVSGVPVAIAAAGLLHKMLA